MSLPIDAPADLERFLAIAGRRRIGAYAPLPATPALDALLVAARRKGVARGRLAAMLAGAIPFGASRGDLWLYVLGDGLAHGAVLALDPELPSAPRAAYKNLPLFALACALEVEGDDTLRAQLPVPGVAEQEAVRAAFERARLVLDLVAGDDAAVRRAARKLALRPLDVPPPSKKRGKTPEPFALGGIVEAFFRYDDAKLAAVLAAHAKARDPIVAEAAALFAKAPKTALGRDLARRRALALRAARPSAKKLPAKTGAALELTKRIVERIDHLRPAGDPHGTSDAREEALVALGELGDRAIVPSLVARAVTGDVSAVEMLGALRDPRATPHLIALLDREPQRYRHLEAAVVRSLAQLGASQASKALLALLADNPMPSWREGIERGVLVRELVSALGTIGDEEAGPALVQILEATSQEYRAILPHAAWALGRVRHLPALATLERLLASPKEQVSCESVWAVGAIGAAHDEARARARNVLDALTGLEPGAEMVRLTALAKLCAGTADAPRTPELRRAFERALWDPAFRQDETARRRVWAFRSLEELARLAKDNPPSSRRGSGIESPFFLGHEAVRHFVTRDDPRVRRAAEEAFAAWGMPVPETRRYYTFVLDDLEQRGGLEALHEAVRDLLGVYRRNVAARLAERGDPASVRPLAEATARLFAEPPTSTYEYDDAPAHLVAFVRALAKLNRPEGNDVLIEGLRSGNHQVRAVVAENAPDDERFVPELMAMLGDPRSFLRSRAERSLAALGVRGSQSDAPPRLVEV